MKLALNQVASPEPPTVIVSVFAPAFKALAGTVQVYCSL